MWDVIPILIAPNTCDDAKGVRRILAVAWAINPGTHQGNLNHIHRWKMCLLVLIDDNKSLRSSLIDIHKRLTPAKRFLEEKHGSYIQHST